MKSKQLYRFTSDKLDIDVGRIEDYSTYCKQQNTYNHKVILKDSCGNVELSHSFYTQSGEDIFEAYVTPKNGFDGCKFSIFELLDIVIEQKLNPYNDDISTEDLVKIYEKIIMKKLLPKSLFRFEDCGKKFIQYDFLSWSINEFGRLVILYSNGKKFMLDVVWDEIELNMRQWHIEDLFKWESTSLRQAFVITQKHILSEITWYESKLSDALDVLEYLTEFKQKQSWE